MNRLLPIAASKIQPALRASGKPLSLLALIFFALTFDIDSALASSAGLKGYAKTVTDNTNSLPAVLNYISFILGAVLVSLGLSEIRRVVDGSGGGSLVWRQPLAKLFFGGMFLALPSIVAMVQATMNGNVVAFNFTLLNPFRFGALAINGAGLSGMLAGGINNVAVLVSVASFVAIIMAIFFIVRGIQMLRAHIENPGNNPLPDSLKRLAVGGALASFPLIVTVIRNTFGVSYSKTGMISNTGWSSTPGNPGGLDGMMTRFIGDISTPAYAAIEIFCYIAGVLIILFAMQRLIRTAQDGPRGPLGFGTVMSFLVAGALISFPQFLSVIDNSLGGDGVAKTNVDFMSMVGAVDPAQIQNAKNVFSAVLAFMAVIGFLSVARGLFLLKGFADGNQQASMMSVITHIVAGSLCINLGSFINAVQTSLGITAFPVTFS